MSIQNKSGASFERDSERSEPARIVLPRPTFQGRAIVEPDGDGGFLVLLPNGEVVAASTARKAEQTARRWFKRDARTGFDVGLIEWRGGAAPSAHAEESK